LHPKLPTCFLVIRNVLYFYYDLVVNRNLHSYPTRRSSDLRATPGHRHAAGRSAVRCGRDRRGSVRPATAVSRRSAMPPRTAERPDRKSTRLNSSHVGISYAVFCLKKKNAE